MEETTEYECALCGVHLLPDPDSPYIEIIPNIKTIRTIKLQSHICDKLDKPGKVQRYSYDPEFKQLYSNNNNLYGLDSDGRTWQFNEQLFLWKKITRHSIT